MGVLFQDLRYATRMLTKSPVVTAVVVLSLALGIGANSTIFSFVNALLLRPPAVESPAGLLEVWNSNPKADSALERYEPLTYPDYAFYRDQNQVFSGLFAFDGDPSFVSWSQAGQGEMVQGQFVSGNYFSVLGVKAELGRTFLPEEDETSGTHPVVLLSHAFWSQHLGSDRSILGQPMTLNGQSLTVIGVAPVGFTGMLAGLEPDFWAPLMMVPVITRDTDRLTNRGTHWLMGVGRLKPGIGESQASADLKVLAQQILQDHPKTQEKLDAVTFAATMVPGPFRGYVSGFTGLLMGIVTLVLLVACANMANLLLAQATARRREMAIRSALGANRIRLIRQTLTESLLLSSLGGGIGIVLSLWATQALLALTPPSLPIRLDVSADSRVLGFTLLLSILTGVVVGLAPAFRSSRFDLASVLKDEGSGGGYRRSRLRNLLVIAEVAVCMVLLIGAGLCLRSLLNARSMDPGFDTGNRVVATLDLDSLGYSEQQGKLFYKRLVERAGALPGVHSVSLANYLPLASTSATMGIRIDGYEPPSGQKDLSIGAMDVGPDYFRTMGTAMLSGREFTVQDHERTPSVAIINEAMAKRFWPGRDPIGQQVRSADDRNSNSYEVIGVAKTGKYRSLSEDPRSFMFLPFLQHYHAKATLVARVEGDPKASLSAIRGEVQALDANLVLIELETLQQYMELPLFPVHVTGILLGAFGLLALALAMGGLYGVMAYVVVQRTREIGIRLAMGAQSRDVLKLVIGEGMTLAVIGVAIGLAAAFVLTRLMADLLFDLSPTDPATFFIIALLLAGVVLVACYLPARRATKVDPMEALRYE